MHPSSDLQVREHLCILGAYLNSGWTGAGHQDWTELDQMKRLFFSPLGARYVNPSAAQGCGLCDLPFRAYGPVGLWHIPDLVHEQSEAHPGLYLMLWGCRATLSSFQRSWWDDPGS